MDAVILERILYHIHNWFERESFDVKGCEIENGELPASITSSMMVQQWYRIQGSYLNDGLHQHPDTDLNDETFDGTITLLAIPRPLLYVAEDIADYIDDTSASDQAARQSKYKSESFGGYTYQLKDDSRTTTYSGGLTGWQAAFASDLNPWRKIS